MRSLPLLALLSLAACNQPSGGRDSGSNRTGKPEPAQGPEPELDPYKRPATSPGGETPVTKPEETLPASDAIPLPAPLSGVSVQYDFTGTLDRASPTAAVVRMVVPDAKGKTVKVSGTLKNLNHSSRTTPVSQDVVADARGVIDFAVNGLEPDTVYRMNDVRVGDSSVKDPYFLVTVSEAPLSQGRRKAVLRALTEAYLWDHDAYDRSKGYANSGGWCDAFYVWAAHGPFTVSENDYGPDWFDANGALSNTSVADVGKRESVIGDMIRYDALFVGMHTFMVVTYDQDTGHVWSVEGNYNNRVMRDEHELNSVWRLGHLSPALLSP